MIYRLTGMIAGFARWAETSEIGYAAFVAAIAVPGFLVWLGWMEGRW